LNKTLALQQIGDALREFFTRGIDHARRDFFAAYFK
jgi:hypothetical protein